MSLNDNFIFKARKVHGDKYDYSLVNYINNRIKVKIILNDTIYEQSPTNHLQGKLPERINNQNRINTEKFIEKARNKHGDKYDYSLVVYVNNLTPIKIIYNDNVYEQLPKNHLNGSSPEKTTHRFTKDEFIEKSKKIHGDKYDYSLVE